MNKTEHRRPTTHKKPKSRQDKAFERLLMIIGIALLAAFILGAIVGASIANAVNEPPEVIEADGTMKVSAAEPETTPELWIDLGEFECYAYDACVKCCGKTDGITKTGTKATANRTVAVDPDVIPLGSTLLINGKEYIAEDIGGAIKGNEIDIFHNTHSEALEFGKRTYTVQMKVE